MLNRESPSTVRGSASSRYWVRAGMLNRECMWLSLPCAVSTAAAASSSCRPAGLICSMALGSVGARASQPEVCAVIQPNHLLPASLGASDASPLSVPPPAVCDVGGPDFRVFGLVDVSPVTIRTVPTVFGTGSHCIMMSRAIPEMQVRDGAGVGRWRWRGCGCGCGLCWRWLRDGMHGRMHTELRWESGISLQK